MTDIKNDPEIGLQARDDVARVRAYDRGHVAMIRRKVETADSLGPFWREMMIGALAAVDRYREQGDRYGVALMMIREGAADPAAFASDTLAKEQERQP